MAGREGETETSGTAVAWFTRSVAHSRAGGVCMCVSAPGRDKIQPQHGG